VEQEHVGIFGEYLAERGPNAMVMLNCLAGFEDEAVAAWVVFCDGASSGHQKPTIGCYGSQESATRCKRSDRAKACPEQRNATNY